jgi:acetyltransferase-like isoleucine patch superfamily enzyme
MKIIDKIKTLYRNHYWSLEKLARHNGCQIGTGCFIGSKFWSSEPYLIKIGNNCAITSGVKIFTHGGARVMRHKHPNFDCFGKVVIGDYVYIGSNSLIMPGVTIGNNVTIGAGSVVAKCIPDNVVAVGNPCRIIKNI